MLTALRGLVANLLAGARLALFLPVERPSFRVDAAQLLLLALVSALVDVGADWLRYGPDVAFDVSAVGGELAAFGMLLLAAALLAWLIRDGALTLALPVIVLAAMPLVQLASTAPLLLSYDESRPEWVLDAVGVGLLAWFLLVLARSAYVALAPHAWRPARALVAGALLALPLAIPSGVLPEAAWWAESEPEALAPTNPAAEPILSLQRELQDDALAALSDHTLGETDLYFVAFAPDGQADVWRERMDAARKLMDGHWGTEGRSLVYVNDASRLTEAPIASVTHLREALEEIAAASNLDEDVVMLYLAGRGNADGSMTIALPPLGLVQLSGPGLASLLAQAGIRWRVIVLATCAPDAFVDALADAQTLVIAAAGCPNAGEPTALGDALFGDALATAASLPAAFAAVHRRLEAQGSAPVVRVGEDIAAQLAKLRSVPSGRAALSAGPRG